MKKLPQTVESRLVPLFQRTHGFNETQAKEVAEKVWHVVEFMSEAPLKDGMDCKEVTAMALTLALDNQDVATYCKEIRAPRTLSAETKKARLLEKMRKQASEMGYELTITDGIITACNANGGNE